jgi:hypothetical protein
VAPGWAGAWRSARAGAGRRSAAQRKHRRPGKLAQAERLAGAEGARGAVGGARESGSAGAGAAWVAWSCGACGARAGPRQAMARRHANAGGGVT